MNDRLIVLKIYAFKLGSNFIVLPVKKNTQNVYPKEKKKLLRMTQFNGISQNITLKKAALVANKKEKTNTGELSMKNY
jgi:hypothetical protein